MEKRTIVARMEVQKGKEQEFLEATKELIKCTRAEEGNISYTLYQCPESPSMFIFYEEYKDEKAMDIHSSSAYLKAFGEIANKLLAKEKVIERF